MNKSEEIELLREVADKLGPNSYCGPWLASVADGVEIEIRGDFFPTPTLAGTRKDCEEMVALAKDKAEQIEADARTKGDKMLREVENRISLIKDRAVIELSLLLKALEGRL